jgi:hypothetical protein
MPMGVTLDSKSGRYRVRRTIDLLDCYPLSRRGLCQTSRSLAHCIRDILVRSERICDEDGGETQAAKAQRVGLTTYLLQDGFASSHLTLLRSGKVSVR